MNENEQKELERTFNTLQLQVLETQERMSTLVNAVLEISKRLVKLEELIK